MMDKSAAELISVTKSYGQSIAVDEISLKIPGASYTCLLGHRSIHNRILGKCSADE